MSFVFSFWDEARSSKPCPFPWIFSFREWPVVNFMSFSRKYCIFTSEADLSWMSKKDFSFHPVSCRWNGRRFPLGSDRFLTVHSSPFFHTGGSLYPHMQLLTGVGSQEASVESVLLSVFPLLLHIDNLYWTEGKRRRRCISRLMILPSSPSPPPSLLARILYEQRDVWSGSPGFAVPSRLLQLIPYKFEYKLRFELPRNRGRITSILNG